MAKTIKAADLGKAIEQELTTYHKDVIKRVNLASLNAVKALVSRTKATAQKKSGAFRRAITYKEAEQTASGDKTYVWGAKAPEHRKTHLLVNGHAKVNGGRVPGDPFLANALAEVLPGYVEEVKEAVKNG